MTERRMILPEDAQLVCLLRITWASDVVLDCEITPNRPRLPFYDRYSIEFCNV